MAVETGSAPVDLANFLQQLKTASATAHGSLEAILRDARRTLPDVELDTLARAFAEGISEPTSPLLTPLTRWTEEEFEYSVDTFFGKVLAELSFEPREIVALVTATIDARPSAEHWTILGALERWCAARPGRARSCTELVIAVSRPASLLSPLLRAGMVQDPEWHFTTALEFLATGNSDCASQAGLVLTGDTQLQTEEVDLVLDAATARLADLDGENHARLFDGAIGLALRTRPDRVPALLGLVKVDEAGACRRFAARHLAIGKTYPDRQAAGAILEFLLAADPIEPMVVDTLDNALHHRLPAEEKPGPFSDALLKLVVHKGVGLDLLDSCTHAILKGDPARRDQFFGRFMVEGGANGVAAFAWLAHRQLDRELEPEIDFASFELDPEDALVLMRRVVGLVTLAPKTAIAILLSILRTGPAGAGEEGAQLIFDPILLSFWEDGRAFLEQRLEKEGPVLKEIITRLIGALDDYTTTIRETGFIDELFPPESNRFLAALKRAADSREISRQASEASIFASIIPTSLILNGDSTVFRVFDGDGESKRSEQPMQSVGYSHPLPQLDAIDPFGFWYRRRLLINGMNT
ncbi:hypothetical protein AAG607_01395 [Citromicrobium bathyomarinum]|uniref:hypothetical protein n=1 Tax=Citromicrobium bathyomarinum TaxID=72174 RepID=UPI00315A8F01